MHPSPLRTSYIWESTLLCSVCLWDIYTGALLHRFGSHAGEITRLYVPPPGCTPRVQHCVCGIASDNSVSLLSLKVQHSCTPSVVLPVTKLKQT